MALQAAPQSAHAASELSMCDYTLRTYRSRS